MNTFLRTIFILLLSNTTYAQLANFTANPTSGCSPLIVNFTNTSTGNVTSYSWNFGNGASSTLANPSTTYTAPGVYTVSLTVSGTGGSNTKTSSNLITVNPQPSVSFSAADTAGCPCKTVNFNSNVVGNSSGPVTYQWSFGDGATSSQPNPSHTYCNPGIFDVTLVATNSVGCSKTVLRQGYINIYQPPVASTNASTNVLCQVPGSVTFTNNSTGTGPLTAAWTFGDGGTGTGNTISHSYTTPNNFTVRMIVTDSRGCKDTIVHNNYIIASNLNPTFSASTVCLGDSVLFANTSVTPPIISFINWNFGDGTTGAGTPVRHRYSTAGTYTVKMIAYFGNCTDTGTQTVTVNGPPIANFTWTPLQPCPAPRAIQYHATGGISYQWTFGNGTGGSGANPVVNYTRDSFYTVKMVVTDGNGCKDSIQKTDSVRIYDLNVGILTPKFGGCIPVTFNFTANVFSTVRSAIPYPYPYSIASYTWTFGDGSPSTTGPTATHSYTVVGAYYVKLTVVTANGCTKTDSILVAAGDLPIPNFTAAPSPQCANQPIVFTNLSSNADSYLWKFGNGQSATAASPTYKYPNSGLFTVKLYAYRNGCVDSFVRVNYIRIKPPNALFEDSVVCPPSKTVYLTNTSDSFTSHQWYFSDGTTSTALNPVHTFPALGIYTITLVTFNNLYGCSDTSVHTVSLIDPAPSFTTSDSTICKNESVRFSPTYPGPSTNWYWRVKDVLYQDTINTDFDHYFNQNGYYSVTFIVKNGDCYDSIQKVNHVLVSRPSVGFTVNSRLGCTPFNVNFTDTSNYTPGAPGSIRSWILGPVSPVGPSSTTSYTYNSPGIYDIKLIATDANGCSDSVLRQAYVEASRPFASFSTNDSNTCIGTIVQFFNTSTSSSAITCEWDFGDGSNTTVFQPTHVYMATGNYTVRLIVTDAAGCKDTLLRTNYVKLTKPVAAFNISDTVAICPPLLVNTSNLSAGAVSYNWTFGTGGPSILTNPVFTYVNPGIYTIRLIAKDSYGCTDSATRQVRVLGYAGSLTYNVNNGCAPLTVTFTSSISNVSNLTWDFSDGVTQPAVGNTITHTYLNPGAYVPKLIFGDGLGCSNSSQGLDTIKVDAVRAGFTVSTPCINSPAAFLDTSFSYFSPKTQWLWTFDTPPTTSNAPNPTHTYTATGTYTVKLVAYNSRGCKDSIQKQITIYPLPVVDAGRDTIICLYDAVTLHATGAVNYLWSPATALSCTNCQQPIANPTSAISYVVVGRDGNGCSNTDIVSIGIKTKTVAPRVGDGEVCKNEVYQLLASGGTKYLWYPPLGLDNAFIANPKASPPGSTSYTLVVQEASCIPDTQQVRLIVHPLPQVVASASPSQVVAGSSTQLKASGSNMDHFEWLNAQTLSCSICPDPQATPQGSTIYQVIGITKKGCRDTASVKVDILCNASQLFIPNTFTPNGDGQNDKFFPRGAGLKVITSLRIYSRWGEVIFERKGIAVNDEGNGWDGTFKNTELPPDVYVYVIEGICDNDEPVQWKGDITLMR